MTSRRIIDTTSTVLPASAWLAGLAVGMLGVGVYGVSQPLMPPLGLVMGAHEDFVPIMDFMPAAEASSVESAAETPSPPEPEVDIPPVPEMVPPLTPPEVPELHPIETPPPVPVPLVKPPEPKAAPKLSQKPTPATKPSTTTRAASSANAGSSASPTLFTGAGAGRFSSPSYPAAARVARQQGTVRLLVTVEASGLPSAIEVLSSSGFSSLDNAARDHLRRRWRWPAGTVRRFIVPIRFTLQ